MQLFVRDASTVVVDAPPGATVLQLRDLWTLKAFGVAGTVSWALVHGGRTLPEGATLEECGLHDGASLGACLRLRGGGGDGGSTGAESRSCYLEMYQGKKPDKADPAEELLARWTRCHLSGEPLAEPVVADELGSLFNKEAVVHALLNRTMPAALAHIAGLKQLITLALEPAPGAKPGGAREAAFQCPVTGLEMNGRARFVVHRPTGRAIAERALKDAPAAVVELLGGAPSPGDLIIVNPTGDELQRAKEALAERMLAERAKKAAKKAAKRADVAPALAAVVDAPAGGEGAQEGGRSGSPVGSSGGSGGGNDAVAGHFAAGSKRTLPAPTAVTAVTAAAGDRAAKKLKVPDNATPEVYKSIFHTAAQATAQKETFACRAVSGRWRC